ncbi:pilus assembly protein PilW [Lysobacteraceae bacterium NML07-0707]|nr:pilus assembly protein PilW [Xanthomonadaceae bacterium NML07-0707]
MNINRRYVDIRWSLQQGLSLIELMIAMLIGLLLILGIMQVFSASRVSYQLSEGMSRTQENSRFAIDMLQRDIRMAGHFGCISDQALNPWDRASTFASSFETNAGVLPTESALRFDLSIQGFDAQGSAPGDSLTLLATPAAGGGIYTPALPADVQTAIGARLIPGSDVLALRYLLPEGVPVTGMSGSTNQPGLQFDSAKWEILRNGMSNPGLFGVSDCRHAQVFQASAASAGAVNMGAATNNRMATFKTALSTDQLMLYRAESVVYFIGRNDAGRPSLYRARFNAPPGGALTHELMEVVEGIENMQLLYGVDRRGLASGRYSGVIDHQSTAQQVAAGGANGNPAGWRNVGLVQVGLLASSPDRSASMRPDNNISMLGVSYTLPADARYRAVYETTIALRNRLFGETER